MKLAVIGLGRTGLACAEVMSARGAHVHVYEQAADEEKREAVEAMRARNVAVTLGTDLPDDWEGLEFIVVSPGVKPRHPLFTEAARYGVPVISEIELAYQIAKAPIVAVTGTNGKSTTAALIAHFLVSEISNFKFQIQSAIGVWLCGNIAGTGQDRPLIRAAHEANESDILVAEVSSFQLEHTRQFRPKVSVITNIKNDHLDYHGTWECYARAKGHILAAQTEEDWAVLNADDEGTARLLTIMRQEGVKGLDNLERAGHIAWFSETATGAGAKAVPFPTKEGLREVGKALAAQNSAAAACAARLMGATDQAIERGLETYPGLPHRMEFVAEINEVVYINNSMCTNAAALERSLQLAGQPSIAIVGGVEKNNETGLIARIVANYSKFALLIGDSAGRIEECLRAQGYTRYECVGTLDNAVQRAQALAAPGDVVILAPACASFDQFTSFEDRGERFKQFVKQGVGRRG
jgi:UDP-N-acetylmuramoylalanine--D-glutamate ligase